MYVSVISEVNLDLLIKAHFSFNFLNMEIFGSKDGPTTKSKNLQINIIDMV